jgi:uncharacterized protein
MKEYSIDFDVTEKVGVDLISVLPGELIEIDLRLESVTEGVLASANLFAVAKGECIRCLDPVEVEVDRSFQELYRYESPTGGKHKGKRHKNEEDDLDIDDELQMDGDYIDLDIPIRDAIVLSLPINPLCSEDCQGLCPECGAKWAQLPEDHAHQVIDPRWAGLEGLNDPDFKN